MQGLLEAGNALLHKVPDMFPCSRLALQVRCSIPVKCALQCYRARFAVRSIESRLSNGCMVLLCTVLRCRTSWRRP